MAVGGWRLAVGSWLTCNVGFRSSLLLAPLALVLPAALARMGIGMDIAILVATGRAGETV